MGEFVREAGRQLLEAVSYMHELKLTHTDIKQENIMLNSKEWTLEPIVNGSKRVPTSSSIKLIDFGSTALENQYHSSVVSTRHYRAPEVVLGLGWSYPCDLWSVGCLLIELLNGVCLFQTHETLEHLAMMEAQLGKIPYLLIKHTEKEVYREYLLHKVLHWPEGASSEKS